MRLEKKVAIVTGGSRGIGSAIALQLASEGAIVAVNYVEDKDGKNRADAEKVSGEIRNLNTGSIIVQADVSDIDQANQMANEVVSKFGRIDILVNNAGINKDATLKNLDKQAWDAVISVNLTGVFNCTKAVIGFMSEAKSGRIINTASVMGQAGGFGISNYAASKAGIIGFTKSVAREVAGKGITVNAIAPGFIEVGMFNTIPEKIREVLLKQIPAGRWGKPEEIGKAVVFLASEDAAYITGQVININGGYYM
ncbi:MAG TPA: 3-oxoacyl-ACP reductase family protein [bacterium]|nr:3-oxoacyl-ACP reductase family protein [bacterium]